MFCVSHNSLISVKRFISSIGYAKNKVCDVHVEIFVLDNSTIEIERSDLYCDAASFSDVTINFIHRDNDGYFPTIHNYLLETKFNLDAYDVVTVSNVDVELDVDFFMNLNSLDIRSVGVIGPSIIDYESGVDRNPKILIRPSLFKLRVNWLLFIHPIFYAGMRYVHFVKRRLTARSRSAKLARRCYAVHGAFFIFTKSYFDKCNFGHQSFLFGEELFVAENCKDFGVETYYEPHLKVTDHSGVSTGNLPSKKYCELNRGALTNILRNWRKG